MKIKVNFQDVIGKIKPMHGVGQAPILGTMDYSLFGYLQKAGIPYSRLHDVCGAYGGHVYVDIPNLFRDFNADAENPENYDFAFTDELMKAIIKTGAEPFFRLGVSIENCAKIRAYNIYPPSDNLKWAKICAGIIKHYNEGWGNGFNYNIKYWEIWNEPDNEPEIMNNPMWRGTKEQYFELYRVSSKYLKEHFPKIKIGGYSSCGFYSIDSGSPIAAANSSDRIEYFLEYFIDFLEFVKENDCPLDFFSWHSYDGIERNINYAEYARNKLDEYGFKNAENICNEWNIDVRNRDSITHAVNNGAMLLAFQNTSLDLSTFYDAGAKGTYGMFNPYSHQPFPVYYSFMAFNELYRRGCQVRLELKQKGVYAVAAKDENDGCILIVNTTKEDLPIGLETNGAIYECLSIDSKHLFEKNDFNNLILSNSIICLKVRL